MSVACTSAPSMEQKQENPCCAMLKKKCTDLEEGRKSLRKALKVMEHHITALQSENLELKQGIKKGSLEEELSAREGLEEELNKLKLDMLSLQKEKEEESTARKGLEEELSKLRLELSSTQKEKCGILSGKDVQLLETRALEAEAEVNMLRKLLGEEKKKGSLEKELSARKVLEGELNKLKLDLLSLQKEKEKESTARKGLEEELSKLRLDLSSSQKEKFGILSGKDVQLIETHALETEAEVNKLRKLLDEEKKKVSSEKRKFDKEKKKCAEVLVLAEAEKKNAVEERRLVEIEKKKLEDSKLFVEKNRTELANAREELRAIRKQVESVSKTAETERLKAEREKKNAETERVKAETLRKAAEAEKKKALEEKLRADHLFEQLKFESQKREYIEKEVANGIADKRWGDNINGHSVEDECIKVKSLQESLKFEKKQTKYARMLVKIQKAEKKLLWRELDSLKQNFSHVIEHQNMIDYFLLGKPEHIGFNSKLDSSAEQEGFKGKGDFSNALSQCHKYKNKLIQGQLKNLCSLNCSDAARENTGLLLSRLDVNCSSFRDSGINSVVESPVADSHGQMKHKSAACSTSASFSDGQYIGSQVRGQLVAASATESRCRCPDISCKACKVVEGQHTGASLPKSVGTQIDGETLSLNPGVGDAVEPKGKGHARKKKRTRSIVDSVVPRFCSDDPQEAEDNPSVHSDVVLKKRLIQDCSLLNIKNNKKIHASEVPDDNQIAFNSKGEIFRKQKSSTNANNEKKCNVLSNSPANSVPDDHQKLDRIMENNDACRLNPDDFLGMVDLNASLPILRDIVNGDIMKFFELENESDEERYRAAVAVPLSPTLPVLDPYNSEQSGKVASDHLLEDVYSRTTESVESEALPSYSFDNIDIEVGLCNQTSENVLSQKTVGFLKVSGAKCSGSSPTDGLKRNPSQKQHKLGSDSKASTVKEGAAEDYQNFLMEEVELPDMRTADDEKLPTDVNGISHELRQPFKFHLLHFTEDKSCIYRMGSAINAISYSMSTVKRDEYNLGELLFAALDVGLQPEEKSCVLLSVLIDHYSRVLPPTLESTCTSDHILWKPYKTEIQNVVLEEAGKQLYLDTSRGEKLLYPVQYLLISRVLLNCSVQMTSSHSSFSTDKDYHTSGVEVEVYDASYCQLAAASLVLASLCSALGNVGYLHEVSCNVLLSPSLRKNGFLSWSDKFAWTLAILHTFASVCGPDYFLNYEKGRPIDVIQCAVLLLESNLGDAKSRVNLVKENSQSFSCKNCPFAVDSIGVDDVIDNLLTRLEKQAKSPLTLGCQSRLIVSPSRVIQESSVTTETKLDCNNSLGTQVNCFSVKDGVPEHCPDWLMEENFLDFVDALSFLELLGCYLDWLQIHKKILPRLMKVSKSCLDWQNSAALVLIGKLGRLKVGTSNTGQGTEDSFADVREFLLGCLNLPDSNRGDLLLSQVKAFEALHDLLPMNINAMCMDGGGESGDRDACVEYKMLRDWFLQLSKEQRQLLETNLNFCNSMSK